MVPALQWARELWALHAQGLSAAPLIDQDSMKLWGCESFASDNQLKGEPLIEFQPYLSSTLRNSNGP